ncbi:hypothetical protein MFMK1_002700 [Metallumcola ferriviriculae]|uniref:Uncharacterized protein n=1 Tax=Metallumcola ferriviriculae TaxID=3039180 RepID=A0AAU0URI6_9FIRM|nr:hypothetical protein MFMK1_002700 [Desulfitibacteraceae bacterium MK1]
MSKAIGVKFCGNCNPELDSMDLFNFLKEKFPCYRFITGDYSNISCLIILGGCETDCATRPEIKDVPVISVAGHTLNRTKLSYQDLKQQLTNRLGD